jgi:hypothetical protein
MCTSVVHALEHDLLDGMPELQPAERGSKDDQLLKHEHVELDLLGLLRHGHVQYDVLPVDGRRQRAVRNLAECRRTSCRASCSRRGRSSFNQQRSAYVSRHIVVSELITEPIALRRQHRDVESALILQMPHEQELGVVT